MRSKLTQSIEAHATVIGLVVIPALAAGCAVGALGQGEAGGSGEMPYTLGLAALLVAGLTLAGVVLGLRRRLALARHERTQAEAFYRSVVDHAGDGIALMDPESDEIILHNAAFAKLTGLAPKETLEQIRKSVFSQFGDLAVPSNKESKVIRRAFTGVHTLRKADGSSLEVETAAAVLMHADRRLICLNVRDVTKRREAERAVRSMAYHDPLTGLPNRLLFADRLKMVVARASRTREKTAILFIDLDNFKAVNDSMGHAAGDALLKEISSRLRSSVRESDTVARQGGDEFLVILNSVASVSQAVTASERILGSVRKPVKLTEGEVFVSASIGVVMHPDDGSDADVLIRNADVAMYHAKEGGRNQCQLFNQEVQKRIAEQMAIRTALARAVTNDEFELHYQPKIETYTGKISGVEALVRWRHPERGLVPPGVFIPVAEETGLIVQLGEWVIREACRQAAAWKAAGTPVRVGVNLSGRQFKGDGLLAVVEKALSSAGLDPGQLDLEITESVAMQDPDRVRVILEKLRAMGASISLDDFGTGYSSLSYLRRFPFDYVKIDRSFLSGVETDFLQRSMVGGIVSLAHMLRLRVIAEGIETAAQISVMKEVGCDELQGFGFCKPLPAAELQPFLAEGASMSELHRSITAG